MRFPGHRILIFARAPEPGRCKTRLIPALGAAGAARLAARLLEHTVARVRAAALAPALLCCHPHATHPALATLPLPRHTQRGRDLGERMATACARTLAAGARGIALIGTDCPALDGGYLARALAALERADLVLGPAEDGGYVLVAMKRLRPGLFGGIDWGTERVLEQTLVRARGLGLEVRLLEPLWDLDRPRDLERLRKEFPAIASG